MLICLIAVICPLPKVNILVGDAGYWPLSELKLGLPAMWSISTATRAARSSMITEVKNRAKISQMGRHAVPQPGKHHFMQRGAPSLSFHTSAAAARR